MNEVTEKEVTARVTVSDSIIKQQIDAILISNRVMIGVHEVFIHFNPVSEIRFKRDYVMLCYFIKVEVECVFAVCFRAFKAYVALQYGLSMFKKLREADDANEMLETEKAYLVRNQSDKLEGEDVENARKLLFDLTPMEVQVMTDEFGLLSLPENDEIDDFLATLRHGPIPKSYIDPLYSMLASNNNKREPIKIDVKNKIKNKNRCKRVK